MRLFIGILFVVVAIVIGVSFIPPFWANYQFEDAIKTEALMATNSTKSEDAIRDSVFKRAQDFGVPLDKEKIKVQHIDRMALAQSPLKRPIRSL